MFATCSTIAYQLNIGLSQGSSILISRSIGHGDRAAAGVIAGRVLTTSVAAMMVYGLIYIVAPHAVLTPFLHKSDGADVVAAASGLLWFAIAYQYLKGAQNVCVGLLRGLGNTKSGLRNTLVGYWAIGIPAMVLFAHYLGLRGDGVWRGLCTGFGGTAALLLRRFRLDLNANEPELAEIR